MNKLEQFLNIIDTALQGAGKSNLTNEVIDSVGGYISPNNRHLLNNFGAISKHYFEIGSHVGSSLISTVYGNNLESAVGCDNWSLFNEEHNARKDFFSHCDKWIPTKYRIIEKDCFAIQSHELPEPIDLFLIDGAHDYESQRRAIVYFAPFLAGECILLVDDAAWPEVNKGTMDGLFQSGLNIEYLTLLDSGKRSDCGERGFWNGIICCLVKKTT